MVNRVVTIVIDSQRKITSWTSDSRIVVLGHALRSSIPGIATQRYFARLQERSHRIAPFLQRRMFLIAAGWLALAFVAGVLKTASAVTPIRSATDAVITALPYILLALAPVAGFRIANAAFSGPEGRRQPGIRLSILGRWKDLGNAQASAHPAFGTGGFVATLMVGLLINIVIRTAEFMVSVPALNHHAPEWGQVLMTYMTMDIVIMNFFYGASFALALRALPLFPRMMVFTWTIDVAMQLSIAQGVAATDIPPSVAGALHQLLDGNLTKVFISIAIWLPYLILSERVNVTYRQRAIAPAIAKAP